MPRATASASQPASMRRARHPIEHRARDRQNGRVFRQQREARADAGTKPPPQRAAFECADQTQRRSKQRTIQRSIRQHPRARGHAEHRRQVQQHRRAQSGTCIGDCRASRYISHVDSANRAMNGSRTTTGASLPTDGRHPSSTTTPPEDGDIPEAQDAPRRDHVAFIHAKSERCPEREADRRCRQDQQCYVIATSEATKQSRS